MIPDFVIEALATGPLLLCGIGAFIAGLALLAWWALK